jgi:integrase
MNAGFPHPAAPALPIGGRSGPLIDLNNPPRIRVVDRKARRIASVFKFPKISATVPFLEYRRGPYRYYALYYYEGGKRRRETRSTYKAARARAEEIAIAIQNGRTDMLSLRQADKASYLRACEISQPTGQPLELVASIYTESLQILRAAGHASISPLDAIRTFVQEHPAGVITKTVPDVLAEMLHQMQSDRAGKRWIEDLDCRLSRFAKKFTCPITELHAPAINAWLRSLDLGPRSRNNYRIALMTMIAYAKKRNYLPRQWDQMSDVDRAVEKSQDIKIFTPEQMTTLLAHALPNLVPFLVLAAFAGLRHEELTEDPALDWRDINLETRLIYVPSNVAKAGTPDRIVPIQDNLAAWLTAHAGRNGPVCQLANVAGALRRTADRAKIKWLRNSLRKSFISYRLAITRNIGQVADEAGNSPQIIKSNYRRPIPETEAKRWFQIWPTNAEVLQLNFAGI